MPKKIFNLGEEEIAAISSSREILGTTTDSAEVKLAIRVHNKLLLLIAEGITIQGVGGDDIKDLTLLIKNGPVPEKNEKAFEQANDLRVEILAELDRIRAKIGGVEGLREHERLFNEIFNPEHIDKATLLRCIVYHGLITSSPPSEADLIDLPGDQSLMNLAKRKLEELKNM